MKANSWLATASVAAIATLVAIPAAMAQPGGGGNDLPDRLWLVPDDMAFESSTAHYEYLLANANGGDGPTTHTMETIPTWPGLWGGGGFGGVSSVFGGGFGGGDPNLGVLTPEYEAAFLDRIEQGGFGQPYDRLTICEHPGMPRWMLEPYTREFVNTPWQSWFLNDLMDEVRRIYILGYDGEPAEHLNYADAHSPLGDSIGFWQKGPDGEDLLVIHTVDVYPADYFRGFPLTSNQFEAVEVWQPVVNEDGETTNIMANATFYDPLSLVEPIRVTYTFSPNNNGMEAGVRIRSWECALSSNTFPTADGETGMLLPGDPGYRDSRGSWTSAYPDLPGQTRDPEALQLEEAGEIDVNALLGR